jgi:hypothetical protein
MIKQNLTYPALNSKNFFPYQVPKIILAENLNSTRTQETFEKPKPIKKCNEKKGINKTRLDIRHIRGSKPEANRQKSP